MHTPLEFYIKLPEDLFRLGRKSKAKMDYIRTTPPRPEDGKWDVRLIKQDGIDYVDSKSGGLSLFNRRDQGFGDLWWKIPKGTELPEGLHISFDKGGKAGKSHILFARFITCF